MPKILVILSGVLLYGCCSCPPKTTVTPKPDVTPVVTSNTKIKKQVTEIKQGSHEALKVNQDLQGNLDSAAKQLDKVLGR